MLLYVIAHQVFMKIIYKIALNVTNNVINVWVNQTNALYVMVIGYKSLIVIVQMEVLADYSIISVIAQLVN